MSAAKQKQKERHIIVDSDFMKNSRFSPLFLK